MVGAYTTDRSEGTMSPCRLKLATTRNWPLGVIPMVAGKSPSSARATRVSGPASNFHTYPYGVPCAMVRYQKSPSGETASPCAPSLSAGMIPTGISFSTATPKPGRKTTLLTMSDDSLAT